ncbi:MULTISPECIES: DUF4397 domain-containing protein [Bacillaceae]|uniref:DUF4397 domain-containing protein n=1 Tax=Bacillaceae TaxID=186817 RepID=UPI000BFCEB0A|nr:MULTISPECIES: DUF4397 domain-containing protein [Bacillaceae]PGT91596.1 hypothetical protein COD11_00420 [Bacillus sp. AFS040349]UGB28985.1 DUF4397 domain-containing protein [Metabacillus sp. B2-18]
MHQNESMLVLEAAKYQMLADYYKYSNPQLHIMYYQKHLMCVQQLAAADFHGHTYGMADRAGQQNSFIRVFHASPDAPGVDVYVNGNKAITNLVFQETTDYLQLPYGRYTIEVYPTGETTQPVLREQLSLTRNTYYTVAATGRVANLKLNVFVDKPYVSPNQAKVRFIHLSPGAPNVDIAVQGGKVLFPNVPYEKATDYLTLSPLTVNLEVRVAGTNNVVLTIPQVQLKAGKTYTAVAVGLAGGNPPLESLFLMP